MKKLVILIAVLFGQHLYAQPDIVRFEYFFTEVSGDSVVGDTTKVPIAPANDLTVNINIGLDLLSDTLSYHLHLYGVDENGKRSLQHIDTTSLALEVLREKRVTAKVFLQGPYDANANMMSTNLNPSGGPLQIPLTSPYAEDPRTVSSIPADIVDWVLVELRDDTTGSAVADTSAFLHKDGRIVADDGTTNEIILQTTSDSTNFFIVIRHRNHLSIMTTDEQLLSDAFSILYDFTTAQSQAFTSGVNPMKELEPGAFGMFAADGNGDGGVDALDLNLVWRPQNGTAGYLSGDFNLDGGGDAVDVNVFWRPNNGTSTQVP